MVTRLFEHRRRGRDSPTLAVRPTGNISNESWDVNSPVGENVYHWSASQWGIGWLADSYVLGDAGITPRLDSAEAMASWNEYLVDAEGALTPREYQRVVLMMLVIEGQYFEIDDPESGLPMPMWKASRIDYDSETGMPTMYYWQVQGRPQLMMPPDQVRHLFLRTQPAQRSGVCLFELVKDVADQRRGFIMSIVSLAKLSSVARLFHKRGGGNPLVGAEYKAEDEPKQISVNFDESGITPIGPRDEIISPQISAGPVPVRDVERAAGGWIGLPYGISRMQATRDYSDANYSSARLASLVDAQAWRRYQHLIAKATRRVWENWPGRAMYGFAMPDWVYPQIPSVDPHREAQVDRAYVELGIVSRQEVMRRLGHDPETMMREIDEWRERYPGGV